MPPRIQARVRAAFHMELRFRIERRCGEEATSAPPRRLKLQP